MVMFIHMLLVFFTGILHPFHVSVCEIEFNNKAHSLEISERIFLDDLEAALRKDSGWDNLDVMSPTDKARFDGLMKNLVMSTLSVRLNDGPAANLHYLGHEIEADAMWCYVEIVAVNDFEEIEVGNKILFNMFPDQVNLVHVKKDKNIRSLKLYRDHEKDKVTY